jgi:predicted transcriptional regulator
MNDDQENRGEKIVELTAEIVAAYVANNAVPPSDLADVIAGIHQSLANLGNKPSSEEAPKPAVNPKRSVRGDHIICLEDGKSYKSLKRHLMTHHGLTPEEYREKWGLSKAYPMVAPGYAAARSALAKKLGLGRKPKEMTKPQPVKRRRRKAAS